MGYIYLITNKINNKKYVGQTIQKDINSRWKQHRCLNSKTIGKYLLSAYKKHSIENFKFQIICICFDSDIDKLEEFYIKKYDTLAPNGYNLTVGGKHRYLAKESRDKISNSLKGRIGNPHTLETKNKIRLSKLGIRNSNYGKKMSEEQKLKISETMKIQHRLTDKQLKALQNRNISNEKRIGKYDNNWNLLEIYPSISNASRVTSIDRTAISKVCRNLPHQITAGGFRWKYIE